MPISASRTKPIMLITGLLTCTMIYALFFPDGALKSMFGESLGGTALAQIVVRSWGALITLIGAMLIYGAFRPRTPDGPGDRRLEQADIRRSAAAIGQPVFAENAHPHPGR